MPLKILGAVLCLWLIGEPILTGYLIKKRERIVFHETLESLYEAKTNKFMVYKYFLTPEEVKWLSELTR